MQLKSLLLTAATLSALTACEGIFEDIYDDPEDEDEVITNDDSDSSNSFLSTTGYGFIAYDTLTCYGTAYINTTDYYTWYYLNFHDFTTDTLIVDLDADDILADEPEEWDLALHRWDVRTNGGAGLETEYTSLDDLAAATTMPSGDFVEDEWYEYISVDMSGMMSGDIGYMSCYTNLEIGKWMDVSTETMPPTYTPSNKAYLVRLQDETMLALILSNYMNKSGTKCYLTIDFIYPFTIE